nr:right-handed parallel beta-helix repeat-containing protein [Psychromonas ingrahamii]
MPVGIPEASIDFTQDAPDRPVDWSSEVAGYYYINTQTGSTAQTYGTPTAPRKYWPANIKPGSYIEIAGAFSNGFSSGGRMFTINGTDDTWVANTSGPVWITGAKNAEGYIEKIGFQITGSNVYISDLNFKNGGALQISSATVGYPAKNIVVRNVDIVGGMAIEGNSPTSGSDNIIVYNSTFHDAGDINAVGDEDAHLMTVGAGCSNIWLLNNTAHTASGAGLQVLGGPTRGNTHNVYAAGNEIYNVRQAGMWVKYGSNVVFSSNYIHDIISTPWSVSKGMGAQYEPDELWMINNHVHGAEYGVRVPSTNGTAWRQKVYVIGNVIHDIRPVQSDTFPGPIESTSSWQSAAIHVNGAHDHYIYNNLVFDAPNGIDSSSAGITRIRNNIVLDVTKAHVNEPTGYHILAEIQDLNEEVFIDNNYIGSGMYAQVRHGIYQTSAALNAVSGASDNIEGTNIITVANIDAIMNAQTIDSQGFTALEDAGINVDNILVTAFRSNFTDTVGIDRDIFGVQRKLGSMDIGPFVINGLPPTAAELAAAELAAAEAAAAELAAAEAAAAELAAAEAAAAELAAAEAAAAELAAAEAAAAEAAAAEAAAAELAAAEAAAAELAAAEAAAAEAAAAEAAAAEAAAAEAAAAELAAAEAAAAELAAAAAELAAAEAAAAELAAAEAAAAELAAAEAAAAELAAAEAAAAELAAAELAAAELAAAEAAAAELAAAEAAAAELAAAELAAAEAAAAELAAAELAAAELAAAELAAAELAAAELAAAELAAAEAAAAELAAAEAAAAELAAAEAAAAELAAAEAAAAELAAAEAAAAELAAAELAAAELAAAEAAAAELAVAEAAEAAAAEAAAAEAAAIIPEKPANITLTLTSDSYFPTKPGNVNVIQTP